MNNCNSCTWNGTSLKHKRHLQLYPAAGLLVLVAMDVLSLQSRTANPPVRPHVPILILKPDMSDPYCQNSIDECGIHILLSIDS